MKKKKNLWTVAFCGFLFFAAGAAAEENNFYQDIMFSDEMRQQMFEEQAKDSAARLLDSKPAAVETKAKLPERRSHDLEQAEQTYGTAPFGLVWGADKTDTEALGVMLVSTEMKDYINVYEAKNLPNALNGFEKVIAVFGEGDKLWRILAYGAPVEDRTPDAAKIMKLYKKYYTLLEKKYGNARQNYKGSGSFENNPNLRQELNDGTAEVYATFEGNDIGAALAVNADGDNRFYLLIDYKNLKILKENELKVLQAL